MQKKILGLALYIAFLSSFAQAHTGNCSINFSRRYNVNSPIMNQPLYFKRDSNKPQIKDQCNEKSENYFTRRKKRKAEKREAYFMNSKKQITQA
jgi:hypothetical protein